MAASVKKQANALLAGVSLAAAASYPWAHGSVLLDFVHHTALAATIGGLADWWGVTAIFEKPFNLAAPGTDMLRRRYDDLQEGLTDFVCTDLLSPQNVMLAVEEESFARLLTEHFNEPQNVEAARSVLQPLADEVLHKLNTQEAEQLLLAEVPRYLPSLHLSDILLDVAQRAIANNRLDGIWALLLKEGKRLLHCAEFTALLRGMAQRAEAHYTQDSILRDFFVSGEAEKLLSYFVEALERLLDDLGDGSSELRRMLDNWLLAKLEELRHDIAFQNWINDKAAQLVLDNALALRAELRQQNSDWLFALAQEKIAEPAQDEDKLAQTDSVLKKLLARALELKQDALRQLISEKLAGFKQDDVIGKLQAKVGDDLQNIRISGTVIGGLLGAVLFMVAAMAERLVG